MDINKIEVELRRGVERRREEERVERRGERRREEGREGRRGEGMGGI